VSSPFLSNRETRLNRREERNLFRRRLLPLAWAMAGFGGVGLVVVVCYYMIEGNWPGQLAGIFLGLVILPFSLLLVSFVRGHHSRHLDEP
jgi:drug/metabolite transporter (DMT)-like permease